MEYSDTIYLLKECDSGTEMAISSLDEILDRVSDSNLKNLLSESRLQHEKLQREIVTLLSKHDSGEKQPGPMAKGMSWLKTNMKMGINDSDATAADLITDGCNMGIKTLYRYQNQYKAADSASKKLCQSLIDIEEQLRKDLRSYL